MTGVEIDQSTAVEDISQGFSTANTSLNTTAGTQQHPPEEASQSSAEAEWDPVEFDLKKSSNPKWRKKKQQRSPTKPKRIQDIRLSRLDSGASGSGSGSCGSRKNNTTSAAAAEQEFDDNWPYEDEPGSPCAMFGKNSSSPAEGFEQTGEFSNGDPEWGEEDQNLKSSGSRDRPRSGSSSDRRRKERRRQQQQKQQQEEEEEEEGDGDDQSGGSYELEFGSQSGTEEEEDEEGDYSDESEGSVSHSSNYEDDNLMVTPAIGKSREIQRKKPPTLKRGAHQVATPSILKAMKNKQAFTSDDEGDNGQIDFDAEFDSDMDSGGSGHSRSRNRDNGSKSKREGRFEAANASFRRSSFSKRKEKYDFDRSMSSADLKAARKANNSFKGHSDMNKSLSVLESKRRATRNKSRSEGRMQNSFSSSSHLKKSVSTHGKSPPGGRISKRLPARAKSMGPSGTGSGSKLKSALAKFSGSSDEPTNNNNAAGKYGSTLSALKALSGSDSAGGEKSSETDLKNAIMQQVYRSSSGMNPIELKRKPKPKISKTASLSASGMARAAAASGDIFPAKDGSSNKVPPPTQRVRRSRTANEKNLSSISDFNASYHESIAKMRRQKMADASERSALSSQSLVSSQSAVSQASNKSAPASAPSQEPKETTKERPMNLDRRVKSFSHSRSGASMDDNNDTESPAPSPANPKPRLRRGSSKRQSDGEDDMDGTSGHSNRRNLSKSGSSRRLQRESSTRSYDASLQLPNGISVIALLKEQEPVSDCEMMQKGNRQMFHSLMYKTRMGIDMEKLRRKVEGFDDDDDNDNDNDDTSGSGGDEG